MLARPHPACWRVIVESLTVWRVRQDARLSVSGVVLSEMVLDCGMHHMGNASLNVFEDSLAVCMGLDCDTPRAGKDTLYRCVCEMSGAV